MASTKDIIESQTGDGNWYLLECDGRHDFRWHRYIFYTKKEVVKMYNEQHKKNA